MNVYAFKGLAACAGVTVAEDVLRVPWPRWVVEGPSGFLFLRFDIDLLDVHGKIREHQLLEVFLFILTDNGPDGHPHPG